MHADDLIDEAIEALRRGTGLDLRVQREGHAQRNHQAPDAIVHLPERGIYLKAEAKKWTAQVNVGAIAAKFKQQGPLDEALLVGDYINPALAKRLIEAQVQFVDTAGNAYIHRGPLHVQIVGNRKDRELIGHTPKPGRAFQQTGLKVIFAILTERDLLNAPYRQIADKARVALGNIGWILSDLTDQGYIQEGFKANTRTITNYDRLLNKWAEEYPAKLRTKLRLGTFTTENPFWWKEVDPENFAAFWGGELAAAQYTNYLNPRDFIVYMQRERLTDFLKQARLKKFDQVRHGGLRIDIFKQFWRDERKQPAQHLTHPILTYADLLATADPRNLETAERLREEFIH